MAAGKEIAKEPGKKEGNALPPSIFWGQALLYDIFANAKSNLGVVLDTTRKVNTEKVARLEVSEANKVNTLANIRRKSVSDFIDKISPLEIAQIVPKIEFSLVDANTLKTINIPLTNPTDLKSYAGGGYFQGGIVGLKSVDLTLDGSVNPAFARHYLVDMSFIFDSINTFTSPVPGTSGKLSYDDIFRTQGRAVTDQGYFYRLSISYDGNEKIISKYNLRESDFITTLNLTPVKSQIEIEENLKVALKINFTSIEENILEDKDLFDFLRLDLATAIEEKKEEARKTQEAYQKGKTENEKEKKIINEKLEKDVNKIKSEKVDEFGNYEESNAEYKQVYDEYAPKTQKTEPSFLDIEKAIKAEGNVDQVKTEITKKNKIIKDLEGKKARLDSVRTGRPGLRQKEYEDVVSTLAKFKEEVKQVEAKAKQSKEKAKRFYDLHQHLKKVEQRIYNKKKSANIKIEGADAKTERLRNEAKTISEHAFDSIRAAQISRALADAIYTPGVETGAIKEISVSIEDIRNYFSGGLRKKFLEGEPKPSTSKDKGPTSEPAAEKNTTKSNGASENKMTEKERESLVKRQKSQERRIELAKRDAKKYAETYKKDKEKHKRDQERIKRLEKELEEINSKLTSAKEFKVPGANGGSIGDAASIVDKYSQRKVIKYILFGDLISLLMNRLVKSTIKGPNSAILKVLLDRSVILLSNINVPQAGSNAVRQELTYNIPIDMGELELLLSKKLFGKAKNSYTIFELVEDIFQLLSITKQHISKKFGEYSGFGSYDFSIRTYSLEGSAGNYQIMKAASGPDNKTASYKLGFVLDVVRKGDGFFKSSDLGITPKFFFGGVGKGAMKKIGIKEISDSNLQKAAFEKIKQNTDKIFVPAFFENTVTLIGCPIFHLGMLYELAAPTIKTDKKTGGWLFIEGNYTVKSVKHSYSAGGSFTTVLTGHMASPKNRFDLDKAEEAAEELVKSVKDQLAAYGAASKAVFNILSTKVFNNDKSS